VWLRVKSLRDCSSTAEGLFFDGGLRIVLQHTVFRFSFSEIWERKGK
jgi:hypothetical protein